MPISFSHVPHAVELGVASWLFVAACAVRTYTCPSPPMRLLNLRICVTTMSVFSPVPFVRLLSSTVSRASIVPELIIGNPSLSRVRIPWIWYSPVSVKAFMCCCSSHVVSMARRSSFVLSALFISPSFKDVARGNSTSCETALFS